HTPPTEISTLSLHDALPISMPNWRQHLRPEASKFFVVVSDDDATEAPLNSAQAFSDQLAQTAPDLFTQWSFNGIFCGMDCDFSRSEEHTSELHSRENLVCRL